MDMSRQRRENGRDYPGETESRLDYHANKADVSFRAFSCGWMTGELFTKLAVRVRSLFWFARSWRHGAYGIASFSAGEFHGRADLQMNRVTDDAWDGFSNRSVNLTRPRANSRGVALRQREVGHAWRELFACGNSSVEASPEMVSRHVIGVRSEVSGWLTCRCAVSPVPRVCSRKTVDDRFRLMLLARRTRRDCNAN